MTDNRDKFRFEVKNQADNKSEILIYGYIGPWDEVDYKGFRKEFLNVLSTNKDVTVRLHCCGGSVYEGLPIYDLMRSSDTHITVIVEGMAASMGSIIALGGDTIQMNENAFFMMHAPSMGAWGDKAKLQSSIAQLEECENRLIQIYKERTKAEESTILDWMKPNNDTWVDSVKCLEMGICDEILKPSKERVFQAMPDDITSKSPEEVFAAFQGQIPNEILNQKTEKMKKQIILMLATAGIAHTLTDASPDQDFEKVLEGVIGKAKNCETAEAALKTFRTANATALIDKAVEEGKIQATEKADWLKDAEDNYEFAVKAIARMVGKVDPNKVINKDEIIIDENSHPLLKGKAEWDYDKWLEKDPEGLQKLSTEATAEFDKLYNAKFKK